MGDEKKAENYIIAQGYNIIARKGEIKNYTLEKSMLYGSIRNLQYQQSWGVQKVKPDEYFGKQITVYEFTVENHPLEKIYEKSNGINIYIMLSEGGVIGGYSYPDIDMGGAYYSLD